MDQQVSGNAVDMEFPCGRCMPCRINKRREWQLRIMLEQRAHSENFYLTLTYDDEHLPEGANLQKEHLQKYWRRLRKDGHTFRYFAAGEYGTKKGRPHYHAIIFSNGGFDYQPQLVKGRITKSDNHFQHRWMHGHVDVRPIPGSKDGQRVGGYVAKYVLKGKREKNRPDGRNPEFMVCSRNPGIGFTSLDGIAKAIARRGAMPNGVSWETEAGLNQIRLDGKLWPVNRYLREKILAKAGGYERTALNRSLTHEMKTQRRRRDPLLQAENHLARQESNYRAEAIASGEAKKELR